MSHSFTKPPTPRSTETQPAPPQPRKVSEREAEPQTVRIIVDPRSGLFGRQGRVWGLVLVLFFLLSLWLSGALR